VDSEGRPIIASDVTVNAEGLIVDLGQIKQGPAGTEPWPVQLSGTIKLETIRTSTLTITPGSTIELLAPREVDVNYSSVIINMDVSVTESSLVDGAPVVYYESARVIEFTATNRYRTAVPTVFEPRTSAGGFSSKKMPVTGPFERIRIHNPSSTRDIAVRSVGLTYYRGL